MPKLKIETKIKRVADKYFQDSPKICNLDDDNADVYFETFYTQETDIEVIEKKFIAPACRSLVAFIGERRVFDQGVTVLRENPDGVPRYEIDLYVEERKGW